MKYKIEIWQWHCVTDTYKSDNLEDALDWYRQNWEACYDNGFCAIDVYIDNVCLSWDEGYELGFY